MAPKALKRPAAAVASEETPAKEARRGKKAQRDPVQEKYELVIAALEGSEELPTSARDMLVGCIPESLALLKEERHEYQEQLVGMVGAALANIEAVIKRQIEEFGAKVSGADAEKANRDSTLAAAESALEVKSVVVTEKEAVHTDNDKAFEEAESKVEEAKAAQEEGDGELATAATNKEALESAMKELYTPLKEGMTGTAKELKKSITSLLSSVKSFSFDASMLGALASTLGKTERGDFDAIVLKQFEEAISQRIASIDELIANGEPAKAQREAVVQEAEAARTVAEAKRTESAEALAAAEAEQKECSAAVKAAKKAVAAFAPELKATTSEHEAEQARLAEFQEGALAAFRELAERAIPQEPAAEEKKEAALTEGAVEEVVPATGGA